MRRSRAEERDAVVTAISNRVREALCAHERMVLAVSGGVDSMVLLHAAAHARRNGRPVLLAATFDHATGAAAAEAVRLVRRSARVFRVAFTSSRARDRGVRESQWREGRWEFLRTVAAEHGAPVATAHTRNDHLETVFMRILRGAGPRGLAGLYAESEIVRPLLTFTRDEIECYAEAFDLPCADDPANRDLRHFRNRVRHELLPAILAVTPDFPEQLQRISERSAAWRHTMQDIAAGVGVLESGRRLRVGRSELIPYDEDELKVLWPAIAARAGVVMDRRGTERAAHFTRSCRTGGSIQLSGGIEIRAEREYLCLQRWDASRVEALRRQRLPAPA